VLFPRVRFRFGEDFVGIFPDDHSVAARHEIAALQNFCHATPSFGAISYQPSAISQSSLRPDLGSTADWCS
jgi:hypothetical protein